MAQPQLLTIRQYCARFNRSLMGVYRRVWSGTLPAVKRDGVWRIDASRLDAEGRPARRGGAL